MTASTKGDRYKLHIVAIYFLSAMGACPLIPWIAAIIHFCHWMDMETLSFRTRNGKYKQYNYMLVIDINWLSETREIVLKKLNIAEYSDNWVFSEASSS